MDISVEDLKKRIDASEALNLIDVREEHEYEEQNLGGKLMPLGELPDFLEELTPLKDEEVIVHCRSGARSAKAQSYLQSQGFTNVRNVTGGILAYNEL